MLKPRGPETESSVNCSLHFRRWGFNSLILTLRFSTRSISRVEYFGDAQEGAHRNIPVNSAVMYFSVVPSKRLCARARSRSALPGSISAFSESTGTTPLTTFHTDGREHSVLMEPNCGQLNLTSKTPSQGEPQCKSRINQTCSYWSAMVLETRLYVDRWNDAIEAVRCPSANGELTIKIGNQYTNGTRHLIKLMKTSP